MHGAAIQQPAGLPDGIVYFLPPDRAGRESGEIDLIAMLRALWDSKWLIAVVTALFAIGGLAYAYSAQKWYRAEVVVVPVETDPTSRLMSQFGGLANLVGVNVGNSNDAEPMAVLQSREFVRNFIERHKLMPVLFPRKWDAARGQWLGPQDEWPDVRDGVRLFDERVRRVILDRKTGVVEIWIEWRDPKLAAEWANAYVADVNATLRARTIERSQANVDFLRGQMAGISLVALQQPIGRLLELELQKLMLARSNAQYAFRVVDAAEIPNRATKPRKKLVVAGALFLGAFLSVLIVLARRALGAGRATTD